MKIGILTLPIGTNYGGIIQAWALQTILQKLGHDAILIDKDHTPKRTAIFKYPIRALKKYLLKKAIPIRAEKLWYETFTSASKGNLRFINNHITKISIRTTQEINAKDFDIIIIGSDQIWRPIYANKLGFGILESFGKFAIAKRIPLCSYAASFGLDNLEEFSKTEIRAISQYLQHFKGVSVRETTGIRLCELLGIKAVQVLDPTLLLNKDDYMCLIPEKANPQQGIMTYILDKDPYKDDIIYNIGIKYSLPYFSTIHEDGNKNVIETWLAGFRDAKIIVTDSFHACVFSIIFNKPFIVIPNQGRGLTRIESLLEMLNLKQNIVRDISEIKNISEYQIPDSVIDKMTILKENSINYILNILSK